MLCEQTGCTEEATHHPKICVPIKDIPLDIHQPLGAVLGLKLCKKHVKKFPLQEFLDTKTPQGGGTNKVIFRVLGRGMEPDFDRAYIQPILINCEETSIFQKGNNGANQPVP